MASVNKATSLLIFISILQGTRSVVIEHKKEVNATVGQNISLPCIMPIKHSILIQIQWHKDGEQGEQKLVVFNPSFPALDNVNVTLELVGKINPQELQGSILHLQKVTEKDSGDYVCDMALFPDGSIKTTTKVQVTGPKVSMKVMPRDSTVIEGDTVNITCVSHPPADKYILLSSLAQSVMESQNGDFIVQNVTRHMGVLICQPHWYSSNQHLQSLKATVHLTIDFLDNIECNSESQVQVETGANLTITCEAKSSKSLRFAWIKDTMKVSSSASINLWSLSPDQSGIYTLFVHAENLSRLRRQKDFTVTVMNRTHSDHLSSTVTVGTTPQISSTAITTPEPNVTAMTTPEPNVTAMMTPEPNVTTPTSQPHRTSSTTDATSTEEVVYISTSAPSTGNITTVHVNVTTPHPDVKSSATSFTHPSSDGRTLSEICCTSSPGSTSRESSYVHPDTSTRDIFTSNFTVTTVKISNVLTTNVARKEWKSHMVFVIIPFLLVLILIGFLYRQYLIQKRLDMPPPFKPPPPPVKYTSARNHDMSIPDTDILV